MRFLRWGGLILAVLVILGQLGRFRLDILSDVRPWDDLIAAVALIAATLAAGRGARAWLAPAWALFTGVHLTTLVINLHEWLAGEKAGGPVYVAALAVITLLGAAATAAAARRT